ncbi:MAG TPA: class II aldolase/adducin family protein [Deltaproteobacteria bacterium]|jgi:ribulose-5-phosphate 4-epimerase/fuculose-1-phosphate aldolase|nr:class II aldolase/adducin family protein [Deltaproteobacteria bacterium]OQC28782.1 MAG: L-fuculose phosphate aldolase [Deltaproteobacteria bacterium ADurb.Bin072]HRW79489.1 class II aldolase/adducin family protein [Desulfomonilia bacterium]HNQ85270.1 class II aldolase/adducin family protein [Deltaproteobacteria bacterium]HNS89543.1 class II aldolase/adducin family protein [Deltaproteobacteria bacterium]
MRGQIDRYLRKLVVHGLVSGPGDAQLYGLDDEITSSGDTVPAEARALFDALNINSLIIAKPEPVRWTIISELLREGGDVICPTDSESLTFIHDVPVVRSLDTEEIAQALSRRKGCIVKDIGIVSTGSVSLEQAFIVFSSICFATFVKYFADMLEARSQTATTPRPTAEELATCRKILSQIDMSNTANHLSGAMPSGEKEIIGAMDAAGKAMVAAGLVDSFFGNISLRQGDNVFISQTGSSLDELEGRIDCTAMDGSTTCEITSSSELCAHVRIYELTGIRVILHGHPRFSVIMSMAGAPLEFGETRSVGGIPVVAGEVGAGTRGILHTLPQAMREAHAAIVSGHGSFVGSRTSFYDAFERLAGIEKRCFELYATAMKA